MTELTKLYPMVQIKKNTWEIDEFDCASIFLLIGTEKAMVIDCGMGIGDLRGAIEMITDKPLICVISHGHIDHTANARQFGEIWLNPKDQGIEIPMNYARRRYDTEHIAQRQKGSIGAPYNMYRLYAYDIEVDLREPGPDEPMPVIHDLTDGMQFDLGGRTVTAYECPGHTAGLLCAFRLRDSACCHSLNFRRFARLSAFLRQSVDIICITAFILPDLSVSLESKNTPHHAVEEIPVMRYHNHDSLIAVQVVFQNRKGLRIQIVRRLV